MKAKHLFLRFIFFVFSISILNTSCDKIEAPFTEVKPVDTTATKDSTIVYTRKVLIEDYTGHTCGHCPKAADEIDSIIHRNPNKIVAMAVHSGSFANVSTTGVFTYDFNTSEGTELDKFFGLSKVGNPNGMIDRVGYDQNHILFYTDWATKVEEQLAKKLVAYITLKAEYNASSRNLSVNAKSLFLENLDGNYKLCLFVTEDSIIAAQKDYRLSGAAADIPNYTHKHVLRTSINSVWGEVIASGAVKKDDSITKDYSVTIKSTWNEKKCHVVAFIYNSANYEVIQAEEIKVTKN